MNERVRHGVRARRCEGTYALPYGFTVCRCVAAGARAPGAGATEARKSYLAAETQNIHTVII